MTFQLTILVINLVLSYFNIKRSRQNRDVAKTLRKEMQHIEREFDNLTSIHHEIDNRGRPIHLKISLDEIDISKVKDPETKSYLAIRQLICDFNPN